MFEDQRTAYQGMRVGGLIKLEAIGHQDFLLGPVIQHPINADMNSLQDSAGRPTQPPYPLHLPARPVHVTFYYFKSNLFSLITSPLFLFNLLHCYVTQSISHIERLPHGKKLLKGWN